MKLFAEFAKSEAQADGTVKVWGFASTGAVDSDGETVTPEAMKAAIPDYMKFGAVREMHQQKAAGTAIEASVDAEGRTWFGAHVIDSEAVKKVQAGVYKGFSIGGKVVERDNLNKSIIKGIRLIEVSLVDRPANPEAVITIMKAERTPEDDVAELAELIDAGTVTPAQLVALAKAAQVAPVTPTETVAKGMGSVAELASLLGAAYWLMQSVACEAANEGDGSPLPAALKDWLDAGTGILKDMVAEETAEMLAEQQGPAGAIYLSAKALALASPASVEKAGRALSAASMAQIQSIHDASAALGACAGAQKAGHADDLQKALQASEDARDEAITKLEAAHADTIAKLNADADVLKARVAALEALPAPAKAVLMVVPAAGDASAAAGGVTPIVKADGSVNEVATSIKKIHAGRF
jgi:hypothetical protein